ncbi:MAG: RNA-binding protein [Candidatus Pacebacteria bacterium]|nr:RNA-binding protein [Candidatus Paceibacterota bacterium]
MAKKLYIGGLSYNSTEDSLRNHFAQAGTVESASIIMDKFSGRSKGFGFVEMSTEDEAQKAIETLNNSELDGRSISVAEARPMTDRPARTGGFNRGSGGGFRDRGSFDKGSRRSSW